MGTIPFSNPWQKLSQEPSPEPFPEYTKNTDYLAGPGPYVCDNCSYTTPQRYRLIRHLENKNGCKTAILCKYCPQKLATNVIYQKHLRSCKYKKKYLCKHCEKTLAKVTNLIQHLKICKKNPLSSKYIKSSKKQTEISPKKTSIKTTEHIEIPVELSHEITKNIKISIKEFSENTKWMSIFLIVI